MEPHHDQSPISTLKVDFHCSKDCPVDAKRRLQAVRGVESISVDPKQGLVTVLGKVNPMELVKLLQKMGQRAELWSFQKAPMQGKENIHCRCHHDSESDSDSSDDDSRVYWEHPLLKNMNGKRSKKKNGHGWKERLGFGKYFVKPEAWIKSPRRPRNFPAPPPVNTYNPLMRFYGSTPPAPSVYPYGGSSLMQRYINPMTHYRSYADNYGYTI